MKYFLLLVMAVFAGDTALAARVLEATIELDGQLVLRCHYSDGDLHSVPSTATTWTYFARPTPFESTGDLPATLRGAVTIRIKHASHVIAQANVRDLVFNVSEGKWSLPPEEVQRTATAAGLTLTSPDSKRSDDWRWPAGILLASSLLLGWFWFSQLSTTRPGIKAPLPPPNS